MIHNNIRQELMEKLQPIMQQKLFEAANELNNDLTDIVEYEFAQETAAGAPYIEGFNYLEEWIVPRIEVEMNGDDKLSMHINLAPNHSLHPGLDTLLKIVAGNVMEKLKYDRRGEGDA